MGGGGGERVVILTQRASEAHPAMPSILTPCMKLLAEGSAYVIVVIQQRYRVGKLVGHLQSTRCDRDREEVS